MTEKEYASLLEEVCAIDSRTIDGAAGTTHVAEIFGGRLKAMGFDLEWVDASSENPPRGKHLKAVRNGGARGGLFFLGHTDTILSPADVPWRYEASSGRVYGSGVCDMKGGTVLMLGAIEMALAESQASRDAAMVVLLDCSEELSVASFRALVRGAAPGARACLNFEPSLAGPDDAHRLVISRKGVVRHRLICHGRAAHAGNAHPNGVNAIRELARKIEQLEALTDYSKDLTLNVGRASGGVASNQVAEYAVADFGVRAFDPAILEWALAEVTRICSEPTVRSAADGATTRLELSRHLSYPPWPRNAGTETLARRYGELADKRGVKTTTFASGGGADANHVADLMPTLDALGIRGGNMHSTQEWADLASLPLRARIAADLIVELCEGQ